MKYRRSFVTNSSSTSYICDVCGCDNSGWDMSLRDAEMYQCVNGHTQCEVHVNTEVYTTEAATKALEEYIQTNSNNGKEYMKEYVQTAKDWLTKSATWSKSDIKDILDDFIEIRYNLPAALCPVCQLEIILDYDLLNYILKKYNLDRNSVYEEMQKSFKTINDLDGYIRGK